MKLLLLVILIVKLINQCHEVTIISWKIIRILEFPVTFLNTRHTFVDLIEFRVCSGNHFAWQRSMAQSEQLMIHWRIAWSKVIVQFLFLHTKREGNIVLLQNYPFFFRFQDLPKKDKSVVLPSGKRMSMNLLVSFTNFHTHCWGWLLKCVFKS